MFSLFNEVSCTGKKGTLLGPKSETCGMESSTKPKIGLHTKNQLSIPKMAKWTTKGPKMSSMPHCAPGGWGVAESCGNSFKLRNRLKLCSKKSFKIELFKIPS